jgi:hypothetical protein
MSLDPKQCKSAVDMEKGFLNILFLHLDKKSCLIFHNILFSIFACKTISIFSSGVNLEQNDRLRVEAGGSAVRISRLNLKDSANYTCSAQNHFGFDQITYALAVKCKLNNLFNYIKNVAF